jgi:hypothetical protein
MAKTLDDMLGALSAAPMDGALDGLEAGVWAKVDEARRAQAAGGVKVQLAVAVAALAMGAVVGGVSAEHRPGFSEAALLSEDAALAPSVAIEGGA